MPDWSSIFSVEIDLPSAVPATWGTRLHGIWGAIWAFLMTVLVGGIGLAVYTARTTDAVYHRWLRRWGRAICWGLGVRIEVSGRIPTERERPLVLVANHQCALDVPVHAAIIDRPFGYLAKEALRTTPVLGAILRRIPTVFVDRRTPKRALRSLQEAAEAVRAGRTVLIYPEGERTFAPEMAPFLKGAFRLAVGAGARLVPITLLDSYRLMDERHLRSRPGTVHVAVGAPISVEETDREDVQRLMDRVRREMSAHLPDRGVSGTS